MVADKEKMVCRPPESVAECQGRALIRILVGNEPNFCATEEKAAASYYRVENKQYADACENGYMAERVTYKTVLGSDGSAATKAVIDRRCEKNCGALLRAEIPGFQHCQDHCAGQFAEDARKCAETCASGLPYKNYCVRCPGASGAPETQYFDQKLQKCVPASACAYVDEKAGTCRSLGEAACPRFQKKEISGKILRVCAEKCENS